MTASPDAPTPADRTSAPRTGHPSAATAAAGVAIVTAALALALAYNVVVPPFEGADESTHYFYAKHIYCTGTLPVQ